MIYNYNNMNISNCMYKDAYNSNTAISMYKICISINNTYTSPYLLSMIYLIFVGLQYCVLSNVGN